MMMAIVGLQLLYGHPEPAGGLPHVDAGLHQPGRRCVAQRMPDDIIAESRILQNSFPGRSDLTDKRLAVVYAVHNEPDLRAVLQNTSRAQRSRTLVINPAPTNQVWTQTGGDLCRRPPLLGRPLQGTFTLIDHRIQIYPWMGRGWHP